VSETPFRPMLASPADVDALRYPLLASPKLDGIRCLAMGGRAMSRSMKPIPNRHVQQKFAEFARQLEGLDGELIVGEPNHPDVYRTTSSAVMAHDGTPDFFFWAFDLWDEGYGYAMRFSLLAKRFQPINDMAPWAMILPHDYIRDRDELDAFEADALKQGFEGVMLRSLDGPYKRGRSSAREGYLLKLKRYRDAEAEIVGFEERMHNGNEAFTSELGRTKRSTAMAGLVPTGSLGAFVLRGLPGQPFEGVIFNVGTGLVEQERQRFWRERDALLGKIVKYKFFDIGVKDAPRHPVYLGFRDPIDL
jgi:DNA ligase-1